MQADGKPVIGLGSYDEETVTSGPALRREESSAEYEFSPVGQVALDRNGRIRRINRAAADLLKGNASQLLNVPFVACVDGSYCRVFLDHFTTCIHLRTAIWSEIVLADFARCRAPVELRSVPGIDPNSGEVFCRTALLPRDVSRRHQMEAELHQAKDLFSQILANNAIATAIISVMARRFVTANQMFYDLVGLTERDVVGLSLLEVGLRVLKEGRETRIEELWSSDANKDIECCLVTPHRETIEVVDSTRVIVFGGEPCALLMVQDLSDLKRLKHDLIQISEEEQRRFGRDLHDSHCQDLTAIVFFAETIAASLGDKDKEIAGQIRSLAEMVRRSAESAHRLAAGLGGSVVEQDGLPHALEEMASHAKERYGVDCSLTIKGMNAIQDGAAVTHLYRITQEAVSNAARHGQAKKIAVTLLVEGDNGILKISDDGQGIPPIKEAKGLGLRTMRYRAAELMGALRIDSEPGSGTVVTCSFPVKQAKKTPTTLSSPDTDNSGKATAL